MHARATPAISKALLLTATILAAAIVPAQAHKCGTIFSIDNYQKKGKGFCGCVQNCRT